MELPEEIKYHYDFKSNFLDLDGLRYHYLDEGIADHPKETILTVHGNPTWSFYYRNIIRQLRTICRVVAPDHIGCGLSDKPEDYDYTLERHIDNLLALIDSLALKNITLVVHDWGGPIGFGAAVKRPELFKRLVVFNSVAFLHLNFPFYLRILQTKLLGGILVRRLNLFALVAALIGCCDKTRILHAIRAGYLFPYNSYANRIAIHRFIEDIPFSTTHPTANTVKEIEEKLSQLNSLPIKIFWGLKDSVFRPSFLSNWKTFFPNASVTELKNAGHYVLEETWEQVVPELIEFINKDRN